MKKLLALAIVALMAGGAAAQEPLPNLNSMGVFFSDSVFDATTNTITTGFAPFNAYIVLIASEFSTIGGYECGLAFSDAAVFALSASGLNGWTNFGSGPLDHLCGYANPLPVGGNDAVVLSTISLLYTGSAQVSLTMGPASIPSYPGVPVIADGADPDVLRACNLVCGLPSPAIVAYLNGPEGVTPVENHSRSHVKNLYD